MTLFEKIYFTCLVLNIVFFILGQMGVFEECYDIIDLEWLGYLLGFQIGLTIGYLVLKFILFIWGINDVAVQLKVRVVRKINLLIITFQSLSVLN